MYAKFQSFYYDDSVNKPSVDNIKFFGKTPLFVIDCLSRQNL